MFDLNEPGDSITDRTIDQLGKELADVRSLMQTLTVQRTRLEDELHRRMGAPEEDKSLWALEGNEWQIRRKVRETTYDVNKLRALGEYLTPGQMALAIIPEQQVMEPAKASATYLRSLKATYKGEVADLIKRAVLKTTTYLEVKHKRDSKG